MPKGKSSTAKGKSSIIKKQDTDIIEKKKVEDAFMKNQILISLDTIEKAALFVSKSLQDDSAKKTFTKNKVMFSKL